MLGVFFFSFIGGGRGEPIFTYLDGYGSSGRNVYQMVYCSLEYFIQSATIITKQPMRDISKFGRIGVSGLD